jgi:pimeloyl-ACP methyl ester carboxylesterase
LSGVGNQPTQREIKLGSITSRVWEKGDGEPLIFLAGLGGLTQWTPCLEQMSASRRVIVPSLPGYPGGTGHDQLDSTLDWVIATLDLIEAVRGEGADWMGVSVGATLVAEAAAASHGCRRLVLVAPFGVFDEAEPVTDIWAQPPGAQLRLLCHNQENTRYVTPDDSDPIERQVLLARANEAAARLLWPTTDIGLARRLHRIHVPTLILRGAEDAVVPASYMDRIVDAIAGDVQRGSISGAGHLADLDAPDAVAEQVLDFLR